jgi:two-component system cell cycle sensor histidine kinase/response regulator CckA
VGKGTGPGLAASDGIVRQNNGFIDVHSILGEALRGTATILLVKDEPAVLAVTKALLENLGYAVLTAAFPGEGVHIVESFSGTIDLILTDVIMPEMSGSDLALRVRGIQPGMRILLMSGYPGDVVCDSERMDDRMAFIQKPLSREALGRKLRKLLPASKPA